MRAQICSVGYTTFRHWVIRLTERYQARHHQPLDLETVVEKGDRYIKWVQFFLSPLLFSFRIPSNIGVYLHDLYFPSPLTVAAFKDDLQILSFWVNFGMGGATLKTLMPYPREGNPRPRLQDVTMPGMRGLINAMGLPGKGAPKVIEQLGKAALMTYNRPIGISLGGNSISEYIETFRLFNDYLPTTSTPHYYEVNISCPNTPEGHDMLKNPQLLLELLQTIRSETTAVIGVKLSPDQENHQLLRMAELVKSIGKTYINLGNTQYKTCEQVGLATNAISIGGGGYSGEGLFPRTLEMVKLISELDIPIIATGGISTPEQVETVLDHGATLVGMATALVHNPYCVPIINQKLSTQRRRLLS